MPRQALCFSLIVALGLFRTAFSSACNSVIRFSRFPASSRAVDARRLASFVRLIQYMSIKV